jgi:hypothetical protein
VRTIATIASACACVLALVATAGCGASTSQDDPTTTPQETTPRVQDEPPPAPAASGSPGSVDTAGGAKAAEQWAMPDLTGAVLQDAQNQIQSLTAGAVYFTDSHDLSGKDRHQVLDDNWQVCTQNVAPGAAITATSEIDLGVVKLGESCP